MPAKLPFWSTLISSETDIDFVIEDDADGLHEVFVGQLDELFSRLGLNICRVDNGQTAIFESFVNDVMQQVKSISGGGLIVFIVRNNASTFVARNDLGFGKKLSSKGRLSASACADE